MDPNQGLNWQTRMFPDWESNWQPCTLWDGAEPTEPCQSGREMNDFVFEATYVSYICMAFRKANLNPIEFCAI